MRGKWNGLSWLGIVVALILGPSQGFAQPRQFEDVLGIRGLAAIQVGGVEAGLPADLAGVRPGDLIRSFNGHLLREFDDYGSFLDAMRIAAFETGATVEVLGYDSASDSYVPRPVHLALRTKPADASRVYLGIRCNFTFLVTEVRPGSPALRLGLSNGDFIEGINGQHGFDGPAALDRAASTSASSPSREITLWVTRWRPVENGKSQGNRTRTLRGPL